MVSEGVEVSPGSQTWALYPSAHQSLCHNMADEAENSSDSLPCAKQFIYPGPLNLHRLPDLALFYRGENRHGGWCNLPTVTQQANGGAGA